MKKIVENVIAPEDVISEDGGAYSDFTLDIDGEDHESGMYVKVCSWDESKIHYDLRSLINKKVRVTIEVID